jgi:hypothetical protein
LHGVADTLAKFNLSLNDKCIVFNLVPDLSASALNNNTSLQMLIFFLLLFGAKTTPILLMAKSSI